MSEWRIRDNYFNDEYVVYRDDELGSLTHQYYHWTLWGARRRVRWLERQDARVARRQAKLKRWQEHR